MEDPIQEAEVRFEAGDRTIACALAEKVLAKDSGNCEALVILGRAAAADFEWEQSRALLARALERNPDHVVGRLRMARVALALNEHIEALSHLERARRLEPHRAEVHRAVGNVFFAMKDPARAAKHYRKAVAANPNEELNHRRLMVTLDALGEDGTEEVIRTILALPDPGPALLMAFKILNQAWRWDEQKVLLGDMLSVIDAMPVPIGLLHGVLFHLNYLPWVSPEAVTRAHRRYGELLTASLAVDPGFDHAPALRPGDRIRLGLVSGNFRTGVVGCFARGSILHLDTARFEVTSYDLTGEDDDSRKEYGGVVEHFVDARKLSDLELARRIHADGIQILVDLAGLTGGQRLATFAYRPAPVQITHIGYANTTGLAQMDYRITDAHADAGNDDLYSERLLYMPECFLCFWKLDDHPRRATTPARERGAVTFGSCNAFQKITPVAVRTWSRILNRLPDARLRIKASKLEQHEDVQARIREAFAGYGVSPERVELMGWFEERAEHFEFYNSVDVALDTFPYNGTTTTADALWMHVPVVTLVGRPHAQRVGHSFLKNLGVDELIAENEDQYVEIAVSLAGDLGRLDEVRERIQARLPESILCQPARYTRQLEKLYLRAWRESGFTLPWASQSTTT